MHEIDFLPAEYRQKRAQRQSQPWRIVVVAMFAAVIAVAALGQHHRRRCLEDQLAEIDPQYDAVVQSSEELEALEHERELARADAELFTYLRHCWPRTRILDALLDGLPDEITFEQLEIRQESPGGNRAGGPLPQAEREAEENRLASLPAAGRDLDRLRGEFDLQQTVVRITGVTTDSAALHGYLGELNRVDLFSKAELDTIESDQVAGTPQLRFRVSLVVRPGYGQPGGPRPEPGESPAPVDRAPTRTQPPA